LTEEQLIWLRVRLAYFIATLLMHRHGGQLCVQDDHSRDFFTNYVVSNFERGLPAAAIVDPFVAAYMVLDVPPPRSVIAHIARYTPDPNVAEITSPSRPLETQDESASKRFRIPYVQGDLHG